MNDGRGISSEIALRPMSLDLTDNKSLRLWVHSGNALVLPGNIPSPEPMLTQKYTPQSFDKKNSQKDQAHNFFFQKKDMKMPMDKESHP